MNGREVILVNPNHPVHLPTQLGSPANVNNNAMAWQQRQQPLQINTARSYESDDAEKTDNDSEVSSIHMGSIRPVANYDPAKDPTSPENFDKPFIAPLEITIRVVHGRRRKTMSSYHSTTTHTTTATNSTTITPPHSSTVDGERQSDWLQSPELPTTQSGSIPQLGPINSFVSDGTDSNSFSGSDQYQSAEQIMRLEEELQGMQEGPNSEEAKQRKGMVRREFNRRIMRFKKGKKKNKNSGAANRTPSNDLSGDDDDDGSDASGNKIIIKLKIDDTANTKTKVTEQQPPKQHFKGKNLYPTSFGGIIKGHRRSKSLQMVFDQENGC